MKRYMTIAHQCIRSYHAGKSPKFKTSDEDRFIQVEGEILYGFYPVLFALQQKIRAVHKVYYNQTSQRVSEIVDLACDSGYQVQPVSFQQLDFLTKQKGKLNNTVHQGICADVSSLPLSRIQEEVRNI